MSDAASDREQDVISAAQEFVASTSYYRQRKESREAFERLAFVLLDLRPKFVPPADNDKALPAGSQQSTSARAGGTEIRVCPECGGPPEQRRIIEVEGDRMTCPGGETCSNPIHARSAAIARAEHPTVTVKKDDLVALLAELDYYRVRMMVAVSFLDSETLDTFHEHVAEIDAKHKEAS